jgi:tRNA(adenine34) deaminase
MDKKYMELALKLAVDAQQSGELPFGAVVVCDDEIVGQGRCQEQALSSVLAHAETEAVDRACKLLQTTKLHNCTIYCTNEPCVMCAAAIFQAKIPRVVIGASRSDIPLLRQRQIDIDVLAKDSGYEIEIVRGVLKNEVVKLFSNL